VTAKKAKTPPVIDLVRDLLWKYPIGTEISFKTVAHIKNGNGALTSLQLSKELKFMRMVTDVDGGRPYKVWVLTGKKKTEVALNNAPSVKLAKESEYVLLCGRKISSLPKGCVTVHRIVG
jgi:radical SAM superfamily enzyme